MIDAMTRDTPNSSDSWAIPRDIEDLAVLCGSEVIADIFETFLDDTPLRFAQVRAGMECGEAGTVRREAHSIKGSSAQIGAATLSAIAAALESGDSPPQLWRPLLDACEAEFIKVAALIRAHPLLRH